MKRRDLEQLQKALEAAQRLVGAEIKRNAAYSKRNRASARKRAYHRTGSGKRPRRKAAAR